MADGSGMKATFFVMQPEGYVDQVVVFYERTSWASAVKKVTDSCLSGLWSNVESAHSVFYPPASIVKADLINEK
jgi:hypothetical protein